MNGFGINNLQSLRFHKNHTKPDDVAVEYIRHYRMEYPLT